MNRAQKRALAVGVVLLAALCAFPYSHFLEGREAPDRPRTMLPGRMAEKEILVPLPHIHSREGFYPFWYPDDPVGLGKGGGWVFEEILWSETIAIALEIVLLTAMAIIVLREKTTQGQGRETRRMG